MQGKAWSGTQTSLSLSFSGSVRLYKHMRSWVVSQSEIRTADRLISICETETSIVSAPSTTSSHGCHRLLSVHQIYALLLKFHFLGVYVLIAIGAVMMFVGFLGCYGAIQESQCLLGTFFTCLVILFACEVAAGLWGFINRDTISTELINFYDAAYIKAVDPVDTSSRPAASKVLEVFHNSLNCCGKGDENPLFKTVQTSLCTEKTLQLDPVISQSCHTKIRELFTEKLHIIGLAALVIAVIMVFEMIFTMVLCCAIRNAPAY
uniref:CD81 molecule b n=2 Tax=Cyprinus carpio TaxID=7962 RepID=A0A8C1N256_CYPCA